VRVESISYLRCPACKGELRLELEEGRGAKAFNGELFCKQCQRSYEIKGGLPNLVYPEPARLPEIDTKFLKQYERIASSYDRTLRLLLLLLGIWEPRAHRHPRA